MCKKKYILLIAILFTAHLFAAQDPNLRAWYKFDETSDVNVADSSGNGFDTVVSGATPEWDTEGAIDGCLQETGQWTKMRIDVPAEVFSTMSTQATIAFWVQLTPTSTGGGWFIGNDGSGDMIKALPYYSGDDLYGVYRAGSTSTKWWWGYGANAAVGEWHHFAVVFDSVADIKKLYFDGDVVNNAGITEGDSMADIEAFKLFTRSLSDTPNAWDSFKGKMDDVRIYDRALPATEIVDLANANPIVWYKFDETSDVNVIDSSGNGFDTVVSGAGTTPEWDTEGAIDGCLQETGQWTAMYIDVPNGVFETIDAQATFTWWAQMTATSVGGAFFTGSTAAVNPMIKGAPYMVKDANEVLTGDYYATWRAGSSTTNWWWNYGDASELEQWYHFALVYDEVAGIKKLYFDGMVKQTIDIDPNDSMADITAFKIFSTTAGTPAAWDCFKGKIDDFRIYNKALSASAIESIRTPMIASHLMPADGQVAEADEDGNLTLYWTPGLNTNATDGHDIYFGTDYNSVNNATYISDEYQGTQTANSYDLLSLSENTTYYWRVDEVEGSQVYKGDTCSFTINHNITFFIASDIHYGRNQVADNEQTNKELIAQMNYIPSKFHYPDSLGGGLVHRPRAVLMAGDLTDYGEANEWEGYDEYDGFVDDFLGLLNYQLYEGYGGNHDYDLSGTDDYSKQQVKTRNLTRPGITSVSTNGFHYSWDWNNVHFVNLNLYPGPQGGRWAEAEGSIDFLISDLAANVGISDNPVVIYHHFGFDDRAFTWWSTADANTYYDEIENYNVIAIFHGHSHDANIYQWNGIDVYDTGTATQGEWAVVNITDDELIFASIDENGWQLLKTKSFSVIPGKATNPDPYSSQTEVSRSVDPSWTAGTNATKHLVYFGTDSTPDATEYKCEQTGTTYDPGYLSSSTYYYWRIDEKSATGDVTTGDIWNFRTGNN